MNLNEPDHVIDHMMKSADENQDNLISFEEFVRAVAN